MPNLAFHLEVLAQVTEALVAQGDPRGTILANNSQFAALGALGPDLLRYRPISPDLSNALAALAATTPVGQISSLSLTRLSELFLNPLGAAYAILFRNLVVPNWPLLSKINDLLDRLDQIAHDESNIEALGAIGDIEDALNSTSGLSTTLSPVVANLAGLIGQFIALPPWMEQTTTLPVAPDDPAGNRAAEFLRWHRSGRFASVLLKEAATDQHTAYALGWLCHVAASVAGEPFINNIAGGPYRTHWWRNRLVGNFIDAWTFGFFQTAATMAGDTPTPPYDAWKPLCSANLQDRFNVGGLGDATGDTCRWH